LVSKSVTATGRNGDARARVRLERCCGQAAA
jgi:hypothetical protein